MNTVHLVKETLGLRRLLGRRKRKAGKSRDCTKGKESRRRS